jgi:hypothetical protein
LTSRFKEVIDSEGFFTSVDDFLLVVPFDFEVYRVIESCLNTSKAIKALHVSLGMHFHVSKARIQFSDSPFEAKLNRNFKISRDEQAKLSFFDSILDKI